MQAASITGFLIRPAQPGEFSALGELIVSVYLALPGMPALEEQPEYYGKLRNVAARAQHPAMRVFAAVSASGELLGSVDFITDMKHYGSGGTAAGVPDAAGIRLLAVKPGSRGMGIGQALTRYCIEQARERGRAQVILHTTKAMLTAWALYEKMGFVRFPEIDFLQGRLEVFGFRLALDSVPAS